MKWFSAMLILLAACVQSHAADWTAASASLTDVQAAVDSASNGDRVLIPNGSATWSGGITTTKQIEIIAQNITQSPAGTAGSGTSSRNVTIVNNSSSGHLIAMQSGDSYHVRVAGIRFEEGTGSSGAVLFSGDGNKRPKLEDCWFEVKQRNGTSTAVAVISWQASGGFVRNIIMDADGNTGGVMVSPYGVDGASFVVKLTGTPDYPWTSAPTMGTADSDGTANLYIEDSSFYDIGQCPDADDHARVVFRHCRFDGAWGVTHGFTSTWGGRHVEYYDNIFEVTFNSSPHRNMGGRYVWIRAGTGRFTRNEVNTPANTSEWNNSDQLSIGDNTAPTGYPQNRQPGGGHNGSGYVSDPIYIWNQTGARAYTFGVQTTPEDWTSMVVDDRDIFVDNGAAPGWTSYTYPHPIWDGADVTAPTVSTVTISANGTTWTFACSETVTIGAGGNGGFATSMSGGAVTLTYSSGSGSSSLVYTGNRTVMLGESGTLAYTQPGSGVEDSAGNDLANFSGKTVVNNSSQTGDIPAVTGSRLLPLKFSK